MSARLLLLGATGNTGRHVLRLALADGLAVRVFVRSPAKIPGDLRSHPALEVVEGDFSQHDAIRAALAGVEHVVCVGGDPRAREPVMPGVVRAIVAGMREHGVTRLVYQAGAMSPVPGEAVPLAVRALMRPMATVVGLGGALRDNDEAIRHLHEEVRDVDWTVTRPGQLLERPPRGTLIESPTSSGAATFVDIARFDLDVATGGGFAHRCPYVRYRAKAPAASG
jgi:nucleoside-diphosphate-sugar epimerase